MKKRRNVFINGKLYDEEPDFKALFAEQEKNIIQYLEEQYENEDNGICYHNEYFRRAIDVIFKDKQYHLLDGLDVGYTIYIDLALMKYGSFEYINQNFNPNNEIFSRIDNRAMAMQNALIAYSDEVLNNSGRVELPEEMKSMLDTFTNYTENYLPQRLSFYTQSEYYDSFITQMKDLYDKLMKIIDQKTVSLVDSLLTAKNIYGLDTICQLINLRQDLKSDNLSKEESLDIYRQMDDLTSKGILRFDLLYSILNFSTIFSNKTLGLAADQIACKIQTKDDKSVADVVNYLCYIFSIINGNIDLDYAQHFLSINKLIQIEHMQILPQEEQTKIKQLLDMMLKRDEISLPDIEPIYKKIIDEKEVTSEEYKEFYDGAFAYLKKNGIMPEKYAEVLFACILDDNSYLGQNLDIVQMEVIIENLIRTKAERFVGNKSYISFSSHSIYSGQVGTHLGGFMQIKHMPSDDAYIGIILDYVTAIHEIRHERQKLNEDNNEFDGLAYLIKKEEIIRSELEGYYDQNYSNIYFELDAEDFALSSTIAFLETLKPRGFAKMKEYEPILKHLKERKKEFDDRFKIADSKTEKERDSKQEKIFSLQETFDSLVAKEPQIIVDNPILETEYNPDGTRKTIFQMFEDFVSKLRKGDNRSCTFKLYKYVLLTKVTDDLKELEGISDITIPKDLPDSSKNALITMKKALLSRALDKTLGTDKPIEVDRDY